MNDVQLISDYLAGDLSILDKAHIERRISEDPVFAKQLAVHRADVQMLQAVERAKLKAELKERFEQGKTGATIIKPMWAGAALAAAAAIVLLLWFSPWKASSIDVQEIAAGYLEPYPALAERGGANPDNAQRDQAFDLYKNQQYAEAQVLFEQLLPNNPSLEIWYGDCLSLTGQYTKAIEVFRKLAASSRFSDAAEWRLALNLLAAEQTAEAQTILQKIATSDHYKSKEAAKIVSRLEE